MTHTEYRDPNIGHTPWMQWVEENLGRAKEFYGDQPEKWLEVGINPSDCDGDRKNDNCWIDPSTGSVIIVEEGPNPDVFFCRHSSFGGIFWEAVCIFGCYKRGFILAGCYRLTNQCSRRILLPTNCEINVFLTEGTYNYTLTITSEYGQDSDEVVITVLEEPNTAPTFSLDEFIVEFVHETKCFHPHGTDDRDCHHRHPVCRRDGHVWRSS